MHSKLQERREGGFTLIELMVVVLIIAILIAIAVPTFLGARERAQDRAAQSNLRNSLTASKVIYADDGNYAGVTAASLGAVEPALAFVGGAVPSSDAAIVSTNVTGSNLIVTLTVLSDSGDCYYIQDNIGSNAATAGTTYAVRPPETAGACQANNLADINFVASW